MNLRVAAESDLAVTLEWNAIADAKAYLVTIDGSDKLADGKRHFWFDPTRTTVKIGKPQDGNPHSYGVVALGSLDAGTITIPTPPAVPTTVSNSLKTGDTLIGIYPWTVETAGDCVKVEFWSDNTKLGEVVGASPYVFQFDTSKVASGDHLFGVVEVDRAGVRYKDENRVTAHVGTVAPPPTPGSTPTWDGVVPGNAWEFAGVNKTSPTLSQRVTVAAQIDGISPPPGCSTLTRLLVLPGDQYGGSTGWRTLGRTTLPDGTITMYSGGHDSSFVFCVYLPAGFPWDANMWVAPVEIHQTKASYVTVTGVAPGHIVFGPTAAGVDVAGGKDGARIVGVDQSILSGYAHGVWHVFAMRYKHDLADGGFELWHAEAGKGPLVPLIQKFGISTQYEGTTNYFEWGIYRAQSGTSTTTIYMAGGTKPGSIAVEFATIAEAVAWGNLLAA